MALFWKLVLYANSLLSRASGYLGAIEQRHREATALKPGTRVRFVCRCADCQRDENKWKASAVWTVDRYDGDADDYRISTQYGARGAFDYVPRQMIAPIA